MENLNIWKENFHFYQCILLEWKRLFNSVETLLSCLAYIHVYDNEGVAVWQFMYNCAPLYSNYIFKYKLCDYVSFDRYRKIDEEFVF